MNEKEVWEKLLKELQTYKIIPPNYFIFRDTIKNLSTSHNENRIKFKSSFLCRIIRDESIIGWLVGNYRYEWVHVSYDMTHKKLYVDGVETKIINNVSFTLLCLGVDTNWVHFFETLGEEEVKELNLEDEKNDNRKRTF